MKKFKEVINTEATKMKELQKKVEELADSIGYANGVVAIEQYNNCVYHFENDAAFLLLVNMLRTYGDYESRYFRSEDLIEYLLDQIDDNDITDGELERILKAIHNKSKIITHTVMQKLAHAVEETNKKYGRHEALAHIGTLLYEKESR